MVDPVTIPGWLFFHLAFKAKPPFGSDEFLSPVSARIVTGVDTLKPHMIDLNIEKSRLMRGIFIFVYYLKFNLVTDQWSLITEYYYGRDKTRD